MVVNRAGAETKRGQHRIAYVHRVCPTFTGLAFSFVRTPGISKARKASLCEELPCCSDSYEVLSFEPVGGILPASQPYTVAPRQPWSLHLQHTPSLLRTMLCGHTCVQESVAPGSLRELPLERHMPIATTHNFTLDGNRSGI